MGAGERGAAIVELALVFPIAMVVFTAILQFGVYVNNSLELENATSLAAEYLSISRQPAGTAWDPCAVTVAAFKQVSPFLNSNNVTYAYSFLPQGATTATTATGVTCSGDYTVVTQGGTAKVTISYPCSLAIYGMNLAPGCSITAQVTEVIQ